jgi:hypothetical protein
VVQTLFVSCLPLAIGDAFAFVEVVSEVSRSRVSEVDLAPPQPRHTPSCCAVIFHICRAVIFHACKSGGFETSKLCRQKIRPHGRSTAFCPPPPQKQVSAVWALSFIGNATQEVNQDE